MFPFQGTRHLNDDDIKTEDNSDEFDDFEWNSNASLAPEEAIEGPSTNIKTIENSSLSGLGLLMGAYSDSEQSEDENKTIPVTPLKLEDTHQPITTNPTPQFETNSDDDAPQEEKILHETDLVEENRTKYIKIEQTQRKVVQLSKNEKSNNKNNTKSKNENKPVKTYYKKRRLALLEKMLESEIRHERNILLQCVRYIVKKEFFDTKNTS